MLNIILRINVGTDLSSQKPVNFCVLTVIFSYINDTYSLILTVWFLEHEQSAADIK